MNSLEVVKKAYSDFDKGNFEGVLAAFDPKIEWRECPGMPFVGGDGIFIGPNAVLEGVMIKIPVYFEKFSIEVSDFISEGDKVVMVGFYVGINKATGNDFRANAINYWKVKDGLLTHFFQAADTATVIR